MADEELVARLRKDVEEWNRWRAALEQSPGQVIELSRANLADATLIQANLRYARLAGANLTHATLHRADLRAANLNDADLTGADLTGANLTDADLTDAELTGATLAHATLIGVTLLRTNLRGAGLAETNLTRSSVAYTAFADVDLSRTRGLETLRHRSPSTIGIDTLFKSSGVLPEAFLRGAGVPESFIAYARSLVAKSFDFYSCFISYSHADKPFARRLHDTLQGQGIRCWLDEKHVLPGDDMLDEVDRGIRVWDKVLLCCSEHSLNSRWVDTEMGKAFQKEQRLWNERGEKVVSLIPLNLDGYLLSGKWTSGKASIVLERRAADFTGWETSNSKFEQAVEQVIRALRADDGAREQPPTARL